MERRDQNLQKSANGRKQRTTNEDLRNKRAKDDCEFVAVPEYLVGYVIGRKGSTIKQIQEQSGARISQTRSQNEPVGFIVRGNKEERTCAKELIEAKLAEAHSPGNKKYTSPSQEVKIPRQFKKVVSGPGGDNLRSVSTLTGAEVTGDAGRKLVVRGGKKRVQHAEYLLRSKVASTRVKSNKIRVYIDDSNLPEGCELQLSPLEGKDRLILPGARSQFRLKLADGYDSEPQGACKPCGYDDSVQKDALSSLQAIKDEINAGSYHKADFWCHFGTLVIRDPDEADVEQIWNIPEVAEKLQASPKKRSEWDVAFKSGVDLDYEKIREILGNQVDEDFTARYDLSFLTPRSQALRCKVWVSRKGIEKNVEEIPIPFSDVTNVLEELRFEDEATRKRCRGWLVLYPKKFLQADILFPGCEIDCRIHIRALTDDVVAKANGVHEKEETDLFSRYLSKLRFTDAEGLILPTEELPKGYLFSHRRCSYRTLHTPRRGFSMIVSKEISWSRDYNEEETKETTDIHLGREEWDRLLSDGDWEPEVIVDKLPEFLQFVREVHVFISDCCKNNLRTNSMGT